MKSNTTIVVIVLLVRLPSYSGPWLLGIQSARRTKQMEAPQTRGRGVRTSVSLTICVCVYFSPCLCVCLCVCVSVYCCLCLSLFFFPLTQHAHDDALNNELMSLTGIEQHNTLLTTTEGVSTSAKERLKRRDSCLRHMERWWHMNHIEDSSAVSEEHNHLEDFMREEDCSCSLPSSLPRLFFLNISLFFFFSVSLHSPPLYH